MSRAAWSALAVAVVALGVGVAAVAAILGGDGGSTTTTTNSTTPEQRGFELPLTDDPATLALGGHDRNLLVGIAARRGGPIEIAALRAETPIPTGELRVALDGSGVEPEPCGRGCSRLRAIVLVTGASTLTVRHGQDSVSFRLPARLPPDGDAVFRQALRRMDSLRSYHFTERLSSGRGAVFTRIDVQAPNRVRLRTAGFESVIIGKTRWDFRDGSWERAPFPGLDVRDVLMWHQAKNPRIVDQSENGTRELVAFGRKPVPAWFRIQVAPSGRVHEAEMTAASHFMLHRYSDFNAGVTIEPPK